MKQTAPPFADRRVRRTPLGMPMLCRGGVAGLLLLIPLLGCAGRAGRPVLASPSTPAVARQALVRDGLRASELVGPLGTLRFFEGGRKGGDTLVLLHGMNRQSGDWQALVPVLRRKYSLLLLDLPGHGESGPQAGPLPVSDLAAAVGALIEARRPGQKVTLIGNSLGGWVALLYAAQHPERVERVIGVDSSGIYAPLAVPMQPKNRDEARVLAAAIRGSHAPLPDDAALDAMVRSVAEGPGLRVVAGLRATDFLESHVADIHVPVDLIWGEEDGVLPLAYGQRLASLIPGAEMHVLPACGHMPEVFCAESLAIEIETVLAARRTGGKP